MIDFTCKTFSGMCELLTRHVYSHWGVRWNWLLWIYNDFEVPAATQIWEPISLLYFLGISSTDIVGPPRPRGDTAYFWYILGPVSWWDIQSADETFISQLMRHTYDPIGKGPGYSIYYIFRWILCNQRNCILENICQEICAKNRSPGYCAVLTALNASSALVSRTTLRLSKLAVKSGEPDLYILYCNHFSGCHNPKPSQLYWTWLGKGLGLLLCMASSPTIYI